MRNFRKKFYLTTAIDYVNAPPHLGHLFEKICADVIARFHRLKGEDVFFLTGTDENAEKNLKAAKEAGIPVEELVGRNAEKFKELCKIFNISFDRFIRTTEPAHVRAAQHFFKKLAETGNIYKGLYEGYYCCGCEEFKTERELVDGKCPEHGKVEFREEECYFFKLSKYSKKIQELLPKLVVPAKRANEMLVRVRQGLKDVSVSRPGLEWGIDTPIDQTHKIYVWVDALVNYLSALGYPKRKFKKYWPADVHFIGKGITWFHSVIWPAMLLALKLPLPKKILVHAYVTLGGEKLAKSKGVIVDPFELAKKYQIDAIRFYLLREASLWEDLDFVEEKLVERTNNELVACLGNFVHRTLTFIWKNFGGRIPKPSRFDTLDKSFKKSLAKTAKELESLLDRYELSMALKKIVDLASEANRYFQQKQPWKTMDKNCLYLCCNCVRSLAIFLSPFLPSSAQQMWELLNLKGSAAKQKLKDAAMLALKPNHRIKKPKPLFRKAELPRT